MAEVLEIQVKNAGSAAGPPRPPKLPAEPAPVARTPSGHVATPGRAAPSVPGGRGADPIGEILGHLGLDRLYQSAQHFFDAIRSPASPAAPPQPPARPEAAAPTAPPQPPAASTFRAPTTPPSSPAATATAAPPQPPRLPAAQPATAAAEGAGAEAAAGAGLEGLAAAAGPAAAAIAVAKVASDQLAKQFDGARERLADFGHSVSAVAGNDYGKALDQQFDSVEKSLKKVPIAGELMSSAFGAAVQPVRSFTEVLTAFNRRAEDLVAFSPQLATSQANAEIRSLFDDIKEAQELGPDLARMADAESSIAHELRDLLLPIKKVIVETGADVLEALEGLLRVLHNIIEAVQEWAEKNADKVDTAIGFLEGLTGGVLRVGGILDLLRSLAKKKDEDPTMWLRDLYDTTLDSRPALGERLPVDPRPNIPIVGAFPGM